METSTLMTEIWDRNAVRNYFIDAITVLPDPDYRTDSQPFTNLQPEQQSNLPQSNVQVKIPVWVKVNAAWWANNQINDETFINGIEYMITENIIVVDLTDNQYQRTSTKSHWLKNTAAGGVKD